MTFLETLVPWLLIALAVILAVALVYAIVCSATWAYHDAEARGKKGWVVALLVVVCKWPISLLFWYALRPELPSESMQR